MDERQGRWPSTAEDEARRWLSAHQNERQLAIVDQFLKEGTGLEVIVQCRGSGRHQKLVVLSNYTTPAVRQRCQALGVDAVFDKSHEADELIEFCISHNR